MNNVRFQHARPRTVALVALLLGLAGAAAAAVHDDLRSATPGPDDRLDAAPAELRLRFTGPVNPALAEIGLTGPDGPVPLEDIDQPEDSARLLVAAIDGPLRHGEYTVYWRIVGADGHPVDGEYRFAILEGAAGLAAQEPEAPDVAPATEEPDGALAREPAAGQRAESLGSRSVPYVLIRWAGYLALLPLLGAVAFRWLVLPLARRRTPAPLPAGLAPRAALVGLVAAAALGLAAIARLTAQAFVLAGPGRMPELAAVGAILGGTTWGAGWLIQAAGVAVALTGFALARRGTDVGWGLGLAAALALGLAPALSGHAAADGVLAWPVLADAVHVLAAGGWLGTLLVVLLVGVPRRPLGDVVAAFSVVALLFAAVLVASGVATALVHVPTPDALLGTGYGRTLLLKLGALIPLFGAGFYNFRRIRPRLADERGAETLRRTGGGELAVAALVLLVTAFLVATPTPAPADAADTAMSDVIE